MKVVSINPAPAEDGRNGLVGLCDEIEAAIDSYAKKYPNASTMAILGVLRLVEYNLIQRIPDK